MCLLGGEFAILLAKRKTLERKLKKAGAISEKTAVELEMLKLDRMELGILKRLVGKGIITKTSDGRYYWSYKQTVV